MNILRRLSLLALGLLLLLSLTGGAVKAYCGDCGLVPLKPLPPIGCKDLKPICVCDAAGENCHWEWVCVK